MWTAPEEFVSYSPWDPNFKVQHVIQKDGKSKSPIRDIGTIKIRINNKDQMLRKVLYVPGLNTNLFSVKQHSKSPGTYFHTENGSATLAFPNDCHTVPISDEITVQYELPQNSQPYDFNNTLSNAEGHDSPSTVYNFSIPEATINVKFIDDNGTLPCKGTEHSAGFDLFMTQAVTIEPHSRTKVHTGLCMAIPPDYYGEIKARSSLALREIDIAGGVIDADLALPHHLRLIYTIW